MIRFLYLFLFDLFILIKGCHSLTLLLIRILKSSRSSLAHSIVVYTLSSKSLSAFCSTLTKFGMSLSDVKVTRLEL
jgi:hypothetical protein